MWLLVILNALGLVGGRLINETVMYVLFGIAFMAFFRSYAAISWELIYRREAQHAETDGKVNLWIVNELTTLMVMGALYFLLVKRVGGWAVTASALQCFAFQLWRFLRRGDDQALLLLLLFVELLATFILRF